MTLGGDSLTRLDETLTGLFDYHAFALTLFRQGIKINVVSKLLGHKDVATT